MIATRNPLVSIIIPVYNGENYLEESINAALAQSYKHTEIIVVNDGSNDNGKTLSIIKKFKNVVLIDKENGGVSSALNCGIKAARGEYISWLSHDDIYKKDKILHQVMFLSKQKDKKTVFYCTTGFIDESGKKINKISLQAIRRKTITIKNSPFGFSINGCSLLIPKEAMTTPFNENYKYIQDTIKWYELLKNGYKFVCSGHKDSLMRIHSKTVTNQHPELYEKEFSNFYSSVRNEVLNSHNIKGLKKSTKQLALMAKKYSFYKKMIEENIDALKQILGSNMRFLKLQVKLLYIMSNVLF